MTSPEISFKVVGDETHFSCGCQTKVIGTNYFIKPCSLKCEVYLYTLEETRKKGNELSVTLEVDKR